MKAERPLPSVSSMKEPWRAQRVCLSLAKALLFLPFVALPFATRALSDFVAHRAATSLVALAGGVTEPDEQPALLRGDASVESVHLDLDMPYVQGIEVLPRPHAALFAQPDAASVGKAGQRLSGPRGGILVRAPLVAQAARSGARPSGSYVPAMGLRPAGLLLAGVSGFGSGLRDGDVLTSVGGVPATSVGAVISAVTGALAKHAPVITGEVWRGDTRLAVAVEIPVMTKRDVAAPKQRPSRPSSGR